MQSLFDRLGKAATSTATNAASKAAEMREINKLKGERVELKNEYTIVKKKLSEYVFKQYQEGKLEDEALIEFCDKMQELRDSIDELGKEIDYAIYLKVEDDVLIQRLTARLNCRGCDAIYNKLFMPPKTEGICDKCGSELFQRADDSLETAQNRLKVFYEQTSPLLDLYRERGLVYERSELDLDKATRLLLDELEK